MDLEMYPLCQERNVPEAYRRFFGDDSGAQAAAFRNSKRRVAYAEHSVSFPGISAAPAATADRPASPSRPLLPRYRAFLLALVDDITGPRFAGDGAMLHSIG